MTRRKSITLAFSAAAFAAICFGLLQEKKIMAPRHARKKLFVQIESNFSGVFYIYDAPVTDGNFPASETITVKNDGDCFLIYYDEKYGAGTDYFYQGHKLQIKIVNGSYQPNSPGLFIVNSSNAQIRYPFGFMRFPLQSAIAFSASGEGTDWARKVYSGGYKPSLEFVQKVREYYARIGLPEKSYLDP